MTSALVLSFGHAASVCEVDIGLDNFEVTFHTRPDAPPKPSFTHTEQRSALCEVQSEAFALMELLRATPDGGISVNGPSARINAKLGPIRFFSQIEVTVARELVEDDVR